MKQWKIINKRTKTNESCPFNNQWVSILSVPYSQENYPRKTGYLILPGQFLDIWSNSIISAKRIEFYEYLLYYTVSRHFLPWTVFYFVVWVFGLIFNTFDFSLNYVYLFLIYGGHNHVVLQFVTTVGKSGRVTVPFMELLQLLKILR